jgi:hypothetical protein
VFIITAWCGVSEVPCSRPPSGPGARRTDVREKNYPLRVILEILLQCSIFITALIIASLVSINIVMFDPGPICHTILSCAYEIETNARPEKYESICSDSRAVLEALQSAKITSPLVQQCQKAPMTFPPSILWSCLDP